MIVYYIDGEKFTTEDYTIVSKLDISSPNEEIPAFENLESGYKFWCLTNLCWHRLKGPAKFYSNGFKEFYLNGKCYENIREWIKDHPNPDLYFQSIGVITETDKVLWYLKN
jgi:hypothetical protein